MKTFFDKAKGLDTLELKFDDRDEEIDETSREIILASHAAGAASARALEELRAKYPEAPEIARSIAPQIFAQAMGASLGFVFGEAIMPLMGQLLTCAKLATMTEEECASFNERLKQAVEQETASAVKH